MSSAVKAAIILGVFVIAAVLIYRYTSPLNQCLRDGDKHPRWCYQYAR